MFSIQSIITGKANGRAKPVTCPVEDTLHFFVSLSFGRGGGWVFGSFIRSGRERDVFPMFLTQYNTSQAYAEQHDGCMGLLFCSMGIFYALMRFAQIHNARLSTSSVRWRNQDRFSIDFFSFRLPNSVLAVRPTLTAGIRFQSDHTSTARNILAGSRALS